MALQVVETLLPLTKPIAGVADWSAVGIMDAAAPPDVDALTIEGGLEEAQPEAVRMMVP